MRSWTDLRTWLLDLFGYMQPNDMYTATIPLADYETGFTGSRTAVSMNDLTPV